MIIDLILAKAKELADMNKDGNLDYKDALLLIAYIASLYNQNQQEKK